MYPPLSITIMSKNTTKYKRNEQELQSVTIYKHEIGVQTK